MSHRQDNSFVGSAIGPSAAQSSHTFSTVYDRPPLIITTISIYSIFQVSSPTCSRIQSCQWLPGLRSCYPLMNLS